MARYMVLDNEVENHKTYKRFANPFDEKNYIVLRGYKYQGDKQCSYDYFDKPHRKPIKIPSDVTLMVGLNFKFDLLYEWHSKSLQAFFKRGGKIWCCQYAEYLIRGMEPEFHMASMDSLAPKYGGSLKADTVKALWEMGMLTSQIDKDMLVDYLIGTEEEGRDAGDIGNTEKIFLAQIKLAREKNMMPMILARMDGLLATTEMEYNGLKIDVKEASRRTKLLEKELEAVEEELSEYIPELPDGLEFNWNSPIHTSALVFGGTVKYKKSATYIDEKTGELARKKAYEDWPMVGGVPTDPGVVEYDELETDKFSSGKKKGQTRTKRVEVEGELKVKVQEFHFEMPGYTTPLQKWETSHTDALGDPVYSTAADVIEELGSRDIPFLKALAKRADLDKDLGTYYVRYDEKKKEYKGMLTCVMQGTHIIHHNLNHTNTVTSRLSSNNPNLQNIPTEGTSEVKKMFTSRFAWGVMLELDYSQLEIVVQAIITGDKQLIEDLLNRVDFHCKRVAAWKKVTYEYVLERVKDENHPDHKEWKDYRSKAKVFSFQRAYGAGAAKIAETTGMDIDEVKDLIEAEENLYPGIVHFNQRLEKSVSQSARPFRDPIRGWRTFRKGHWQAPTGTIYSWRTYDAPAFLKKKGIADTFKPTELKNYPIQGTGGEIVQIILGLLWRHFIANDNYGGKALLCNTVHDCVWVDCEKEIATEVAKDCKRIMESVPQVLYDLYGMDIPVPFPVEAEIGDNLFNKKPIHL